jgi:MoaA/NifB/PqqE/SkfB family radical SAM enzyme
MGPTGERHRVFQIHPTRRCNLRCLHCYSLSGPAERDALDLSLLRDALTDAAAEGYTVAGFSGGEPTMYRPLVEALAHAKGCGLTTTVTSNGMLLTRRRLDALAGHLDLLAISLDGVPESHNRMRASDVAFERMAARLEDVRRSGIRFGFIFTLTQRNLHELDWVAGFALEQGAGLLQIHPLEEVGRAREVLAGERPDAIESTFAHLEALRIQELAGERMFVQLDVVDTRLLLAHPERVFAAEGGGEPHAATPLARLVSPLVLEADGTLVPVEHGFPRHFAVGSLNEARLRDLAAAWRAERLADFRALCQAVHEELTTSCDLPFSNWYDAIAARAEQAAA